jgi:NAD(P)-dependent dehydrogenase (short-subunit alcohol dehydrogenase family)
MPPSPVALILGAGANIGLHSAAAFAKAGYKVAISARKLKDEIDVSGYLNIPADFSDPRSIGKIFAKVKSSFGISPDVVIYNAGAWSVSAPGNPFSISTEQFESDLAVNSSSLFAAAKAAVEGWNEVPGDGSSKNFFYTGNALNAGAQPRFVSLLTLGVGKSASAFLIQNASLAFKEQGYK